MSAAQNAQDAAEARYDAAQQRFVQAPARSVEDIALKLRFLADIECHGRDMPGRIVRTMIRDIEAGKIA